MTRIILDNLINVAYLFSSILFILGLKDLSSPKTARRGMLLAALGMFVAVLGTLLHNKVVSYEWIAVGLVLGTVIGVPMAFWIPMTAVPQRTALSHAFGALAVALVGLAEYLNHHGDINEMGSIKMAAIGFEVLLGSMTFTGSLLAAGKLQGVLPGSPMTYKGQNVLTFALLAGMLAVLVYLVIAPGDIVIGEFRITHMYLFLGLIGLGLLFGVLLVLPIGAADMPVVISILNSYGGLAASATGFVLGNNVLIIAGALDGGSGFLLSLLMCKAMNRSWANVLFGAFGKAPEADAAEAQEVTIREAGVEDVAALMTSARLVIVVPGYGMAVAQAQHKVRELEDLLEKSGVSVKYAIHPVAGRMPGHMNVLLAEANIPYDRLHEMDDINPEFAQADVALVIGANDVTNPAARHIKSSPIYGMPILNVDQARTVIVIKRSMNPGFAGIDNELYGYPNTMMYFGDAKEALNRLINEIKASA